MPLNKILVVYNTCGIISNENSESYITSISSILEQQHDKFDVVISSCLNNEYTRAEVKAFFGNKIRYNFINEPHPVNVTFNHTIETSVRHHGEYEGYMYVDSGSSFKPYSDVLATLHSHLSTNSYGMISLQTNTDTEFFEGLGVGKYRGDDEGAREELFKNGDYLIPVGKAFATHTNLISNNVRKFYGRTYPDIFASHCTESTFSFINAAIGKQWILLKDFILGHEVSMDGQSSGFDVLQWMKTTNRPTYDHPYKISSIINRLCTDEASECGFGYEECRNIFMHDPNQFDDNYHCKNDTLKHFIKDNLFLKKEELDYDSIRHEYYD